jgi:hypothetical protein
MKKRGGYHGGSTVVLPGSGWYSKEVDPALEDYKPTFQEILEEFISEEIVPLLDTGTIANGDNQAKSTRSPSSDAVKAAPESFGYNQNQKKQQPNVPEKDRPKFAKKRANSPFKRPKRQPVIEYKSKKD